MRSRKGSQYQRTTGYHTQLSTATSALRVDLGAKLVALSGFGLVGYGIISLVRSFTGFIELGLTPRHVGGTPEQIRAFSQDLYEYIAHEQVASSGFMVALGVAVIALAWYGIRRGDRWALLTAFLSQAIAGSIALPLHFAYGIDTLGHLGLIYLGALILLVGTVISYLSLPKEEH